eukprot:TRINITY_DN710_c1_g1_i2.p2 TRINITY_DN710_c1_g1~~TRINITY_DN710_c1_g1_i2.p2  ORF type:complete len:105 (-),score=40.27 TRINITY_DN710_c1_g1_i2:104-418(-)
MKKKKKNKKDKKDKIDSLFLDEKERKTLRRKKKANQKKYYEEKREKELQEQKRNPNSAKSIAAIQKKIEADPQIQKANVSKDAPNFTKSSKFFNNLQNQQLSKK